MRMRKGGRTTGRRHRYEQGGGVGYSRNSNTNAPDQASLIGQALTSLLVKVKVLILELDSSTGTTHHRALPTYSLIFLDTWVTQLRTTMT